MGQGRGERCWQEWVVCSVRTHFCKMSNAQWWILHLLTVRIQNLLLGFWAQETKRSDQLSNVNCNIRQHGRWFWCCWICIYFIKNKNKKIVNANSNRSAHDLWPHYLHFVCPRLTHGLLVCLQTCQTTAVLGAVEEAGAFGPRQHKTHHTELAEKGQDAHQGTKRTGWWGNTQRRCGVTAVGNGYVAGRGKRTQSWNDSAINRLKSGEKCFDYFELKLLFKFNSLPRNFDCAVCVIVTHINIYINISKMMDSCSSKSELIKTAVLGFIYEYCYIRKYHNYNNNYY